MSERMCNGFGSASVDVILLAPPSCMSFDTYLDARLVIAVRIPQCMHRARTSCEMEAAVLGSTESVTLMLFLIVDRPSLSPCIWQDKDMDNHHVEWCSTAFPRREQSLDGHLKTYHLPKVGRLHCIPHTSCCVTYRNTYCTSCCPCRWYVATYILQRLWVFRIRTERGPAGRVISQAFISPHSLTVRALWQRWITASTWSISCYVMLTRVHVQGEI